MSAAYVAYTEAMEQGRRGRSAANRLRPTSEATTVRVTDGKTEVLDGPYADTKEQLGGYYLIDVPDLDAALSWAARCPGASARHDRGAADLGRCSAHAAQTATSDARAAAEAVARRSYGKLVAFLAARTRDVAAAEDALSDAFAAALADWPASGVPRQARKPGCWRSRGARLIDAARRRRTRRGAPRPSAPDRRGARGRGGGRADIPDERLALMFACAHPAIDAGIRAPLILQTVLGFDAATIASAFLVAPATMGQRLVRAKNKIRAGRHSVPRARARRTAPSGSMRCWRRSTPPSPKAGPIRPAPRRAAATSPRKAIWLGRLVASLLPDEPEALGLLALMLLRRGAARRAARRRTATTCRSPSRTRRVGRAR